MARRVKRILHKERRREEKLSLEDALLEGRDHKKESLVEFIDSGSTLINLVVSGRGAGGGWARGRVVNIVGDGSTGKTLLALEAAALAKHTCVGRESRIFPEVEEVVIRYNNAEKVMDFDIESMYGLNPEKDIEWAYSETIEDFGKDFMKACSKHEPGQMLIYVLDSLDSLGSAAERSRFLKATDRESGELDGSYKLERQSYLSQFFRSEITNRMKGQDITLFIISQVRKRIGITFGKSIYRTGGKALDFYTHQVCWLYEKEKLHKKVKGHDLVYGIRVRAKCERNKVAKPFREAEFKILFDYGVDDVGSMIDWLFGFKREDNKKKIKSVSWDNKDMTPEKAVRYIEEHNQEAVLKEMVEQRWRELEDSLLPRRKPKYGSSPMAVGEGEEE